MSDYHRRRTSSAWKVIARSTKPLLLPSRWLSVGYASYVRWWYRCHPSPLPPIQEVWRCRRRRRWRLPVPAKWLTCTPSMMARPLGPFHGGFRSSVSLRLILCRQGFTLPHVLECRLVNHDGFGTRPMPNGPDIKVRRPHEKKGKGLVSLSRLYRLRWGKDRCPFCS